MKSVTRILSAALVVAMLCTLGFAPAATAAAEREIIASGVDSTFATPITKADKTVFVDFTVPELTSSTLYFRLLNPSGQQRVYFEIRPNSGNPYIQLYYASNYSNLDYAAKSNSNTQLTYDGASEHQVRLVIDMTRPSYSMYIDGEMKKSCLIFTPTVHANRNDDENVGDGDFSLARIFTSNQFKDMNVYKPSDSDLQIHEAELERFYNAERFTDNFEWGESGTGYQKVDGVNISGTINENVSYVWKEGSALPTNSIGTTAPWPHGPSYYYEIGSKLKSNSVVNASIENDDEEHGQVFCFKAQNTDGSRGPFFRTGKTYNERYVTIEYEAKFATNSSISNYINPNTGSYTGIWQNRVSNTEHGIKVLKKTRADSTVTSNAPSTVSVQYKKYIPKRDGYFDGTKLEGWHKFTYLIDNVHGQYDFFVDGILIATDVSMLGVDSGNRVDGRVSGIMMGSDNCEIYIDNFSVGAVTDRQALDMTVSGFDKLVGTGNYPYGDSRLGDGTVINLPDQTYTGANAKFQGIYCIVDNEDNLLDEKNNGKSLKYSFTNKLGTSFVENVYTYKLKDGATDSQGAIINGSNYAFDEAYKYNGSFIDNFVNKEIPGSAYIKASGASGGYTLPKRSELSVTFTKGSQTIVKDYNIVFNHELAQPQLCTELSFGKPVFETVERDGRVFVKLDTAATNLSDSAITLYQVIVLEKSDQSIYKTKLDIIPLKAGEGKDLYTSYYWEKGDSEAIAGGAIKAFIWANGGSIGMAPVTSAYKITNIPASETSLVEKPDIIYSSLNAEKTKLTLTGKGPINDVASFDITEWASGAATVKEIEIGSGITSVGANTLSGFTSLEKISFPESVQTIAEGALPEGSYTLIGYKNTASEAYATAHGNPFLLGGLRVLSIGNSHTADYTAFKNIMLNDLKEAGLKTNVEIQFIGAGGRQLYTTANLNNPAHLTAIQTGLYDNQLVNDTWDLIILQDWHESSRKDAGFVQGLSDAVAALKAKQPQAEIAWVMDWADKATVNNGYGSDYAAVYKNITDTVELVETTCVNKPDYIIPMGTAIQNARTSYLGSTLNASGCYVNANDTDYDKNTLHTRSVLERDATHMSLELGRYTVGAAVLNKLISIYDSALYKDIGFDFEAALKTVPDSANTSGKAAWEGVFTDSIWNIVKESARNATLSPKAVTQSAYTLDPAFAIKTTIENATYSIDWETATNSRIASVVGAVEGLPEGVSIRDNDIVKTDTEIQVPFLYGYTKLTAVIPR